MTNSPISGSEHRRLAALYDVHGNLPALEAVLEEVLSAGVGEIVVGGDVAPGPMPRASLQCLLEIDAPVRFIRGNGDRAVLEAMRGEEPSGVPESFREVVEWCAGRLSPEHEETIAGWPGTFRLDAAGFGTVLFCHATPTSDTEIFTRRTPEDRLRSIFADLDVALVVCGHTHMQLDRAIGSVRVVNAGSVGMPFGDPGADWLLLDDGRVELRHTVYDLEAAAERIRATDYPQADAFASGNVLRPPTAEEMLEAFAPADAR